MNCCLVYGKLACAATFLSSLIGFQMSFNYSERVKWNLSTSASVFFTASSNPITADQMFRDDRDISS